MESLNLITARSKRLKNEFEFKKTEGIDREQLYAGRNNNTDNDDLTNVTGEELISKMKQTQDDGTEILNGLVSIIE